MTPVQIGCRPCMEGLHDNALLHACSKMIISANQDKLEQDLDGY